MPIYKMDGKKDGRQQYRVRINYTDNTGRARQMDRVAYGSAEAKQLEKQLLDEIKKAPALSRMTIRELYEEYMTACKSENRESTLRGKRSFFETEVLPTLGGIRLDKFTIKNAQEWKNEIIAQELNTSTAQMYFRRFSAMFNYAVKMDYIVKNPLTQIGNFKSADVIDASETLHYYTAEQYLKFAAEARKSAETKNTLEEWGIYVFFNIAFYAGMRKGEINALRWNDIDGNTLHVRRSIFQEKIGYDIETGPKNRASLRSIQIPDPLKVILDEHRARYQQYANFSDTLYVCGGEVALRNSTLQDRNIAYGAAAGLPQIKIHDLRHPYVKHTTKIFSLRLKLFQAQPVPDALRKTRGAFLLLREVGTDNPVLRACNEKRPCRLCQCRSIKRMVAIARSLP